jgi:hypothetical protein
LLGGHQTKDKNGLPAKRYFEDGSEAENTARAALVRLLLNGKPLDIQLRRLLAALFDPRPETYRTPDGAPVERKITFAHRGRGRNPEPLREIEIACAVWNTLRIEDWVTKSKNRKAKVEAAIAAVSKRFNISSSRAFHVWSKYKPLLGDPTAIK